MFLRAFLLLAFVLPYPFASAQNVRTASPFPNSLLTAPGLNYYPQQWPQDQWATDFKYMSKLGIEFVNMGDKAWPYWQKGEGNYSLIGIEEAVNLAGMAGLKVVITIPVTDAPAWLRRNYENIANKGVPQLSNDLYISAVEKLVKGLARKFANNPNVVGWILPSVTPQQWNSIDRSQFAEMQFQQWLTSRYIDIDSLNKAWGLGFTSEPYSSFGEIQLPVSGGFENPLMEASYREHRSDELQAFNAKHIQELAAYVPENQWISLHVQDPASFRNPWEYDKLSFVSWSRPTGFKGYGDAMDLVRHTAFYRSFYSSSGSLGFQTNEGPGSRFIPQTQYVALYQAMASGNHFISPYRFKKPPVHLGNTPASMVERDGETLTGYGKVYQQFIEELEILRDKYPKIPEMPTELRKRRAAIIYSPRQLWNASYTLEKESWDYMTHLEGYMRSLKSMGCPVDFIQGNQDIAKYKVLIVAAYESLDEAMLKRLESFVKDGGNVIFTARSGSKDQAGLYLDEGPASAISSFIGARVVSTDQVLDGGESKINLRGKGYAWDNWAEVLELSGSIPLATHATDHYTGRAAVSFKTSGRGSVSYFGFDSDDKQLELDLLRKIFERMRISYDRMELDMIKEWRDGFFFAINYDEEDNRIPMDPYARIYVGSLDAGQGEICAWREKFKPGEENVPGAVPRPKAPTPTAAANKPEEGKKKKNKKDKKEKAPTDKEKSLFEQTLEKRKKNN